MRRSDREVTGRIVIAGYGMAGARLAAQLRARDPRLAITALGADSEPPYNRILLSGLLSGAVKEDEVALADAATPRVTVRGGIAVTAIDRHARTVTVAGGGQVAYDHLVLATGSRPVIPPLAGLDTERLPPRVAVFRTLADCRRLIAAAGSTRTALVLGGGLLGLEAACGLAARGIQVRVVHGVGHLMERQLDPAASAVLVGTLARIGITTHLATTATGVAAGRDQVTLELAGGHQLTADLLLISCGVLPETRLAAAAGLAVGSGVVVDDRLRTSDRAISAIGDCAEHGGAVTGLVAPAWEQARVLAAVLTGDRDARYRPPATIARLKAHGIDLTAMGSVEAGAEQLTLADPARGVYIRLAIDAGRLTGAIMLGDNPTAGTVAQLFQQGSPVPRDRRVLLLGRPRRGHPSARG